MKANMDFETVLCKCASELEIDWPILPQQIPLVATGPCWRMVNSQLVLLTFVDFCGVCWQRTWNLCAEVSPTSVRTASEFSIVSGWGVDCLWVRVYGLLEEIRRPSSQPRNPTHQRSQFQIECIKEVNDKLHIVWSDWPVHLSCLGACQVGAVWERLHMLYERVGGPAKVWYQLI